MTTPDSSRACPACASPGPHALTVVDGKEAIGGAPLVLALCADCGASFQPHTPSAEELARWYDYMGHNPLNVHVSPLIARRMARIVSTFDGCRQTGQLLEVGCGGGVFVRSAIAAGWQVWGTEISPSCVALLRPLLGEQLHQGSVLDAPFAPGSFDGAAMIEVLEHLEDPGAYLDAIRRLLRPGGRLFLTTPNAHGSAARLLGHRWRAFTNEHLNYFARESLLRLLARHGFEDLRVTATNLDLLALAVDQRHRLRFRRASARATTPAVVPTVPPVAPPTSGRAELRARVADLAIEALNRVATTTRLGDTLRVVAHRR
jgi:2-polyprenyl-3-methyl-5-hydroxy-6-metoxy-1,4-benzoquinol methylase